MTEDAVFYQVPAMVRVHCRQCGRLLEEGDSYYMTDDSSWIFCTRCAPGEVEQAQPEPARARVPKRKAEWMRYE